MELDANQLAERLKALGAHLGHAEVETVAPFFRAREVAAGETLLTAGTAAPAACIVMEGGFVVRAQVSGTDVDVARPAEGTLLGEVSFLDGGPATATVVATEDSMVATLDHASFGRLEEVHPREAMLLYHAFTRTLASRVRAATERFEGLHAPGAPPPSPGMYVDAFSSMFGIGLLP